MSTEGVSPRFDGLDSWPSEDVVAALFESQLAGLSAVRPALPAIAAAVEAMAERLKQGGRIITAGAGTSGRLGALDGSELPPTFGWPHARVDFLIAGGPPALTRSIEGAEDDAESARVLVRERAITRHDVVIGLAASGGTPFTVAAIDAARGHGALTIGIANNRASALLTQAEHPILIDTGPEVIAGSTRMKAGTAQKVVLNLLSTGAMVRLKRVYRGLMVDMQATNIKLKKRSVMMLQKLAPAATPEAIEASLLQSGGQLKTALLILSGAHNGEAVELLADAEGDVRRALEMLSNKRLFEAMGDLPDPDL